MSCQQSDQQHQHGKVVITEKCMFQMKIRADTAQTMGTHSLLGLQTMAEMSHKVSP